MAPIKFEEQIKDKLEQRTVSPSADAWSKLSQQLDAEDKRNRKTPIWWLGIAASVVALVFVSIGYFNTKTDNSVEEIIVKDNIKEVITTKPKETFKTVDETINKDVIAITEKKDIAASTKKNEPIILKKEAQNTFSNKPAAVKNIIAKVEKQTQKKSVIEVEQPQVSQQEEIITSPNVEFKSVVAELQQIKQQTKNTTLDKQVDSLLKLANRELLMDKVLRGKLNVVDADALLQDVEEAMGQSFRTRIYEVLKSGYKEVKEAVAKRDN